MASWLVSLSLDLAVRVQALAREHYVVLGQDTILTVPLHPHVQMRSSKFSAGGTL